MKKLLLSSLSIFIIALSFAQYPNGIQTIGSDSNVIVAKGGLRANGGYINTPYTDTTAANLKRIRQYQGAQIVIGNDIWVRNSTATKWNKIFTGAETDPIFTSLGVYNTGSYANPSWLTSLSWSKITGTPTTIGGYGITDFNSLGDARWWGLQGNAITNTDFIGSTNNFPFRFRTDNVERLNINNDGLDFTIDGLTDKRFGFIMSASNPNQMYTRFWEQGGWGYLSTFGHSSKVGHNVRDFDFRMGAEDLDGGSLVYRIFGATKNINFGSIGVDIPTSMFTLESVTQGTIPFPRMTLAQMTAIPAPDSGLHVYNKTDSSLHSYRNSLWDAVMYKSNTWSTLGNLGKNFPDTSMFLGTTNNTPLWFKTNGTIRVVIDTIGRVGFGTLAPNTFIETVSTGTNYRAAIRLTIGTGAGTGVSVFNTNASYSNPFTTTALFGLASGDVINADFVGGMFPYANTGGIILKGVSNASAIPGVILLGSQGVEGTTNGAIYMRAGVTNGAGGVQALAATSNLLQIANNSSALFTILGSGNTGFGVTAPSAVIHPKAGVAAASGAPLKFNSGTLNTTAESGAVETGTNNNLYYTNSSTVRARVGMWAYIAKTSTYTAGDGDYTIDCTSGTFTVTLPTAVGLGGRVYIIKNSGAGVITVGTTSSQTIDGSTTYSLGSQYKYVQVQSNNANWIVMANN